MDYATPRGQRPFVFGVSLNTSFRDQAWNALQVSPGEAALVQCRYRATPVPGRVRERSGDRLALDLAQAVRAITPGQSGALYDADGRLLGGGVIA